MEDIKDWLFHASTITVGIIAGEWTYHIVESLAQCWTGGLMWGSGWWMP